MSLTLGFAVYVVIWWLTLFIILPWGISRVNPDDLLPGEDPGAPGSKSSGLTREMPQGRIMKRVSLHMTT